MGKYFFGVLRRYVSQNIIAITGTLRLNRLTLLYVFNPCAPEPPVTAHADPRPFYPL